MSAARKVEICPHCGNKTPHRLVYHHETSYEDDISSEDPPANYFLAVCETCDHPLLYYFGLDVLEEYSGTDDADDLFMSSVRLWPLLDVPAGLPEPVRRCYWQALRIKQISPSAFVVQIRRALEAVCDDRRAIKGSLFERLQYLREKNEIPPILVEMSDVIRLLGNLGAHETAQDQEVSPAEASVVHDFFRVLVEYIYVAPRRLEEYRASLQRLRDTSATDELRRDSESIKTPKPRIN